MQQHFYALGAEVARLEQSIQHQRERKQQLYEELDQIKASWQESDEHLRVDSEKVAELDAILAEREPELELISEQQEASAEALALAEEAMQNWQQEWEEFNGKSGESRRQAEVEQSRIQHLEKSQDRLKERIERLRKEQESLDSGPLAQEMRQLEEQVEQYRGQSEENELRSESLQEDINRMRRENGDRGRQLDEAREKLQTLKGRRTSLEALQKAAMGDDGAVSDWINRHELDAEPRLADQVQVDEGWERPWKRCWATAFRRWPSAGSTRSAIGWGTFPMAAWPCSARPR